MPNELTPQEIAERLEKEASYVEAIYHQFGADGLDNGYISVLRSAASIVRRVASGELKPVVHGRWKQDDDGFDDSPFVCSVCGREIDSEYSIEELELKCCPSCGALMDESRDGNSLNGKRKDGAE